jgi:hypothetical protein
VYSLNAALQSHLNRKMAKSSNECFNFGVKSIQVNQGFALEAQNLEAIIN